MTTMLPAGHPDDPPSRRLWPRTGGRYLPGRHRPASGRTPALSVLERERLTRLTTTPNGDPR